MISSSELRIGNNERKPHVRTSTYSEFGRSYVFIMCPYCGEETKAFVWSLAGSGKKCPCGALHVNSGVTIRARI
jgi:hypothetical protein